MHLYQRLCPPVRWSVCRLVTLELKITEIVWNCLKTHLVIIHLRLGLIGHGEGLIELGVGLGINVYRHFIYYHIHLRLGQKELGIGLREFGIGLKIKMPGAPSWPVLFSNGIGLNDNIAYFSWVGRSGKPWKTTLWRTNRWTDQKVADSVACPRLKMHSSKIVLFFAKL